jgi:hypothetical protein
MEGGTSFKHSASSIAVVIIVTIIAVIPIISPSFPPAETSAIAFE